jgi:hypothetical protein
MKSTVDLKRLRALIEVSKIQQWKAAEQLGVGVSCVERWCKKLGLKTERTGPRSGDGHTNWKGGRIVVGRYWYVFAPDHPNATKAGYVAEHRLCMSKHLGRALVEGEVVHHIDGDPANNAIENLMLFSENSTHLKHELTGRTPKHTAAGKQRMREAILRTHSRRRAAKRGG